MVVLSATVTMARKNIDFHFFIHLYICGKVYSPPKVKKTSSKKYKLVDKLFYFQDGFNARMLNAEMSF